MILDDPYDDPSELVVPPDSPTPNIKDFEVLGLFINSKTDFSTVCLYLMAIN